MYCKDNRPHFETVVCCMYKYKWWPKRVCVVVCVCDSASKYTYRSVILQIIRYGRSKLRNLPRGLRDTMEAALGSSSSTAASYASSSIFTDTPLVGDEAEKSDS